MYTKAVCINVLNIVGTKFKLCPHCRHTIFPYNCNDGFTLAPPTGCFPFAFRFNKVGHLRSREELTAEELEDWYLRGPPIPPAPVGWAAYRQQWRRS